MAVGQKARPLHAVVQLTIQIAGASARSEAERTSRSPFGPVTQDGVAGAAGGVPPGGVPPGGVPGAEVGVPAPPAGR